MPRFVILEHYHQGIHWDFMLESGEVLRTWRLERAPVMGEVVAAAAIGDHRRVYLDYEGEISGGRGRVARWDAGEFDWIADSASAVVVALRGGRLGGEVHLTRAESGDWSCRFGAVDTTDAARPSRDGAV
jgi:hypothetical protein